MSWKSSITILPVNLSSAASTGDSSSIPFPDTRQEAAVPRGRSYRVNGLPSDLVVHTEEGFVMGKWETRDTKLPIRSFKGIPYAAPPVGKLRFQVDDTPLLRLRSFKLQIFDNFYINDLKDPRPHPRWNGIKMATEFQSPCHSNLFWLSYGDENCLYLNVFVPEVGFIFLKLQNNKHLTFVKKPLGLSLSRSVITHTPDRRAQVTASNCQSSFGFTEEVLSSAQKWFPSFTTRERSQTWDSYSCLSTTDLEPWVNLCEDI